MFARFPKVAARIETSPERLPRIHLFMTGRMDRAFTGVDVALGAGGVAGLRGREPERGPAMGGGGRLVAENRPLGDASGLGPAVEWLGEIRDPKHLGDRLVGGD